MPYTEAAEGLDPPAEPSRSREPSKWLLDEENEPADEPVRRSLVPWNRAKSKLLLVAVMAMTVGVLVSRFGLGGYGLVSNAARGVSNSVNNLCGYLYHIGLQVYASGARVNPLGGLALPRYPTRTKALLAASAGMYWLGELVKDLTAPSNRREIYQPTASSLLHRVLYSSNLVYIVIANVLLAVLLTGGWDSHLRARGLRAFVPDAPRPPRRPLPAVPTADRPLFWRMAHPYALVAIASAATGVAVGMQTWGFRGLTLYVAPGGTLIWVTVALLCTDRPGKLVTRAVVILVGVTAAGGVAVGSSALFGAMKLLATTPLLQLAVSATFSFLMFVIAAACAVTARSALPVDSYAAVMVVQLFDSVFGELLFLVVTPFTLGYFLLLASQAGKALLLGVDVPQTVRQCCLGDPLAARVNRLAAMPPRAARAALAGVRAEVQRRAVRAAERWRRVDQVLFAETVAVVVVPYAAALDLLCNRLSLGRSTLMPALDSAQRLRLLLAYLIIAGVQLAVTAVVTAAHRRRLHAVNHLLHSTRVDAIVHSLSRADSSHRSLRTLVRGVTERFRSRSARTQTAGAGTSAGSAAPDVRPPTASAPDIALRKDALPYRLASESLASLAAPAEMTVNPVCVSSHLDLRAAMATAGVPKGKADGPEPERLPAPAREARRSILDREYDAQRSSDAYWRRHTPLFCAVLVQVILSAVVEVSAIEYLQEAA